MPAPVASRSAFTIAAVMSGISAFLRGVLHRRRRAVFGRRLLGLGWLGHDLGLGHVWLEDFLRRYLGGFLCRGRLVHRCRRGLRARAVLKGLGLGSGSLEGYILRPDVLL